jgi:hypothetical protein
MKALGRFILPAALLLLAAGPAAAQVVVQDAITVGSVGATSLNVVVPVYIRDVSGSPLGIDQPAGSRIQSFSIKVDYPAAFIQSITFTRAGITAPLTPSFENSPAVPGSVSLLATFPEATQLIPFTSNAAVPGQQIGELNVTLAPTVTVGQIIPLTLDATLTQLTDEGGSGATKETVAAGNLLLVPGAIQVDALNIPTMNEWALLLLAVSIGIVAIRSRS